PLMSTIQELGAFLTRETTAVGKLPTGSAPRAATNGEVARGAQTP
ncbi:MAG: hypothetical protein QOD66_929, partial [Solirubrobacteraceae bacterium]|nr:hypothetical protein [Solirubrobacteraceae bacterium]